MSGKAMSPPPAAGCRARRIGFQGLFGQQNALPGLAGLRRGRGRARNSWPSVVHSFAASPRKHALWVVRQGRYRLSGSLKEILVRDAVQSEPVSCLLSLVCRESTGKSKSSGLPALCRTRRNPCNWADQQSEFPTRGAGNIMCCSRERSA